LILSAPAKFHLTTILFHGIISIQGQGRRLYSAC